MKLCEAPIDVLRGAIRTYQKTEHPTTGKMNAEELVEYMRAHPKARKMIPKSYRQDKQADIPLSIVRKTILQYRRKHHPAPSKLRRAELERYMRRVKIKPVGKELQKLKRDHCDKPVVVDEEVSLNPRRNKRRKASVSAEDEVIASAQELSEPVTGPKKKKRGRPRKAKQPSVLNPDAGARAVQSMLPDLESRAALMDDDDSLAW